MRLYKEYFKRHGIEGIPLVEHYNQGALILRTKDKEGRSSWVVVTMKWHDGGIHPGTYIIEYRTPIHNGYAKGKLFENYSTKEIEWDDYEDYFLNWTNSLDKHKHFPEAVQGDREAVLTAWEIFVYCYDGWFAAQSSELRGYVDTVLDVDLSAQQRYAGYQNCLIYLTARHPGVLRAWKYEVLVLVQHYSNWLADLTHRHGKTQKEETQKT